VFDDTIEHEAWNESDAPRAILIFDVWNPELTLLERDLGCGTTVAAVAISKIKIARGASDSFHASCSIVSSNTQPVPTCHSRVSPPTLIRSPGHIKGR